MTMDPGFNARVFFYADSPNQIFFKFCLTAKCGVFLGMEKKADDLIAIDGKKEAAELLASLDPTHRERILVEIAQRDPELADVLRKGLFRFDQVLALEILELQKVIRAQDSRLLALSLRGMKPEEKQTLYSKIPERQARALEEEILAMGPQKASDVVTAREKIVEFARELHEKGEIHLK